MSAPVALALVLDLDDFQLDADRRGPGWARTTLASVGELVRTECDGLDGVEIRPEPPDSWLVTIRRPVADALAAQGSGLAHRLRDAVAARTSTTASVGLSQVVHGTFAPAEAARLARETLAYKTLGGTGRILSLGPPSAFEPPDLRRPVAALLRSGSATEAAGLVQRWAATALRRGVPPSEVFDIWLPALVLEVTHALTGSPDMRGALAHTPVAELAGIAGIHEHSHLAGWLLDCMTRLSAVAATTAPSPLVERAERLLRERCGEPDLSLGVLAQALAVSPFHLAHVFRRERGTTVKNQLTGLRVRRALRLLAEGELSVGEVGRRCGFRTQRQFRATMQRETGHAPSRLRRDGSRGQDRSPA
ncbi:helix-turn-helix transcriptional regulator [Labedaea rhizosphaerae]|uniref:AraC-like DNA-binding protein n=1 Tax=Labedaea rhizosphaerae TaxID=598644 RepID=A0A4R6S671_LABRH|nr:helix-turn-helix transcriptional regulator [Labedaea rhizosphaerae]TDP94843.1 AraC-like DNA-binding protein [Labedaea rhizosphaerae]